MTSVKTIEKKLIHTIRQELELDRLLDKAAETSKARATSRQALHQRLKDHTMLANHERPHAPIALHEVAHKPPKRDWYLAKTFG